MPLGFHKATLFGVAGVSTGDVVLLHDQDYSNVASASITSGIDSTYGEYIFKFYNINPATDDVHFGFQVNAVDESGYNEVMTTTYHQAFHKEDDSDTPNVVYTTARDQAQGTSYQAITEAQGNGGDESAAGILHLFNPSSTTYVKHFYSRMNDYISVNRTSDNYVAGYVNTTSAIDEISFKMTSGNFDGVIQMYGIA